MTEATQGPGARCRTRVRLVVGLAFLYGMLSVGVFLQLTEGGLGGAVLEPMGVLQVAMIPVAGFAGYVAYIGRARLVPIVGLATLAGAAGLTIGLVLVAPPNHSNIHPILAAGSVVGFLVGFVTSSATFGFVAGAAARWLQQDTVSRQQLTSACIGVVAGGLIAGVSYAVLIHILTNLGDQAL